jgi:two-component system response regulator MprA
MAEATVLLIDDDEDFTAAIRTLLEAEGYAVVTADSGREGLRRLRESNPDVVLLDIMMENTTEGYAVSGAIKRAERPLPIVMLSSVQNAPAELFARSEELELIRPDAYFTKPVDVPRFLETLRALLAQRVGA